MTDDIFSLTKLPPRTFVQRSYLVRMGVLPSDGAGDKTLYELTEAGFTPVTPEELRHLLGHSPL